VRAPEPGAARLARVALADGSALDAEHFVFACGPWLGALFPDAVGRRVVPTRQEVFFFGAPPGDARWAPGALPAWVHLGERLSYGLPDFERRGVKVADDSAGPEVDPTTLDRVPSAEGLARARAIVRERLPALAGAPLVEARVCQYEASSDGHFLVDRHPAWANAWLVGGGSGHGFKMGPALGEHVAALVRGRAAPDPLFAYGRLRPRPAQ
jgi:glycine/D-amino acid oxidase-like deaminating enzyme